MPTVREVLSRIRKHSPIRCLEEKVPYLYRHLSVSGVGVVVDEVEDRVRLQLSRRFRKEGKLLYFDRVPVKILEPFKDRVLFIVTNVYMGEEEVRIPMEMGLIIHRYLREPKRLKLRFPAWKIVSGDVLVGKKREHIYWLMRVPTYVKHKIMFICDARDLSREWRDEKGRIHITSPIRNIIESYRHATKHNRAIEFTETYSLFLFSL